MLWGENMLAELACQCERCGEQIDQPGLCSICLKRHDRVFHFIIAIVWILAVISFGYYYVLFIA
jgi:hypothetical protein